MKTLQYEVIENLVGFNLSAFLNKSVNENSRYTQKRQNKSQN